MMVNFKRLADRAKDVVDKRGGTDALKEDAQELKDIAKGKGSLKDKAKAAAGALKDPGDKGKEPAKGSGGSNAPRPTHAPEGGTPRQAK
jgi:hypothetical protein